MTFKTSAGHAQYKLSLHLITGTHTTKTVDALAKVGGHVRVTEVFFAVEVIFTFRITHITYAHFGSYGLQFAIVVYFTSKTIQRMVGKHQFNNVSAQFLNPVAVGVDI